MFHLCLRAARSDDESGCHQVEFFGGQNWWKYVEFGTSSRPRILKFQDLSIFFIGVAVLLFEGLRQPWREHGNAFPFFGRSFIWAIANVRAWQVHDEMGGSEYLIIPMTLRVSPSLQFFGYDITGNEMKHCHNKGRIIFSVAKKNLEGAHGGYRVPFLSTRQSPGTLQQICN